MDTQRRSGGQSTEATRRLVKHPSIEEMHSNAAENWRRNYYDKRTGIPGPEPESIDTKENAPEAGKTGHERDAGIDFDPER